MTVEQIEYAGGFTLEQTNASRRGIMARAPAWWRQLAERGGSTQANPRAPATAPARAAKPQTRPAVIGWMAGVCCPGVSKPAYGHRDGENLPEQFTPRAWDAMLAQVRSAKHDVPLTLGHNGPVLARSRSLDLVFTLDPLHGLAFEARLRDTPDCRKVLDQIGVTGWGVSIGFSKGSQWIVERDGIGRVRVIDDAVLDEVSIIAPDTGRRAAYHAARCFAMRGTGVACPSDITHRAHSWAVRVLRIQAGG